MGVMLRIERKIWDPSDMRPSLALPVHSKMILDKPPPLSGGSIFSLKVGLIIPTSGSWGED